MHLAPGEGFNGDVQVVGSGTGHFQHGGHRETGTRVPVVLHLDVGILFLDFGHQLSQHVGTADTGHILEADFIGPVFHHLVHDVHIVGYRVDGRVRDGEGNL